MMQLTGDGNLVSHNETSGLFDDVRFKCLLYIEDYIYLEVPVPVHLQLLTT